MEHAPNQSCTDVRYCNTFKNVDYLNFALISDQLKKYAFKVEFYFSPATVRVFLNLDRNRQKTDILAKKLTRSRPLPKSPSRWALQSKLLNHLAILPSSPFR
jgi:hypothetical protein